MKAFAHYERGTGRHSPCLFFSDAHGRRSRPRYPYSRGPRPQPPEDNTSRILSLLVIALFRVFPIPVKSGISGFMPYFLFFPALCRIFFPALRRFYNSFNPCALPALSCPVPLLLFFYFIIVSSRRACAAGCISLKDGPGLGHEEFLIFGDSEMIGHGADIITDSPHL